jgi:activating signal cointegrator complex subunit 1
MHILQGHHASLRERVSDFTGALQQCDPPISGLDESVIIAPRRLHLTLGVMSLDSNASQKTNITAAESTAPSTSSQPRPKTLSSALSLLTDLKPRILDILGDQKLRVALNRMDIMKPERGDLDMAHVLWLGPLLEDEDGRRLKHVCGMFVVRGVFILFHT